MINSESFIEFEKTKVYMALEDVTYRVKLRESFKVQLTLNFEAFSRLSLPNIFIIPPHFLQTTIIIYVDTILQNIVYP